MGQKTDRIELICDDIYSHMDKSRIKDALDSDKTAIRIDKVQELIMDAVMHSSLHFYNGKPHWFSGRIYEECEWADIRVLVHRLMRRIGVPDGDYGKKYLIINMVNDIINIKELIPDSSVMVFRNCVYNVKTGKTANFSPKWKAVTCVPYDYNSEHVPAQWYCFLDRVLPDIEAQRVLQEFLGAIFINRGKDASFEHMMILLGSGGNGKSVVCETVTALLGEENVTSYGLGSLINGNERLKNIAKINGKRLNYCNEIRVSEFGRGSDVFKTIVSGQPIDARGMYADGFMARNIPLLMANANELPVTRDTSDGFLRRLIIMPFTQYISESERDPMLAVKLRNDLPGIFNWVMEGRKNLMARNYNIQLPESLRAELAEMASDNSTTLRYMTEYGYLKQPPQPHAKGYLIQSMILYNDYKRWCMGNGVPVEDIDSVTKFGRRIFAAGYSRIKMDGRCVYRLYSREKDIPHLSKLEGNTTIAKNLSDDMIVKSKQKPKKNKRNRYVMSGGKLFAVGLVGLAEHSGIDKHVLGKMVADGKFDGMWKYDGRTKVFDTDACQHIIRDYFELKFAREQKQKRARNMAAAKRAHFNKTAEQLHLPYRKTADVDIIGQTDMDGNEYVPDDFEISYDEKAEGGMCNIITSTPMEILYDSDGNEIM